MRLNQIFDAKERNARPGDHCWPAVQALGGVGDAGGFGFGEKVTEPRRHGTESTNPPASGQHSNFPHPSEFVASGVGGPSRMPASRRRNRSWPSVRPNARVHSEMNLMNFINEQRRPPHGGRTRFLPSSS